MNYGISWTSIKTLLRLELRSRFGSRVETPVKTQIGRALNILFTLIVYAILVTGIYYLAEMFIVRSELRFEFLVFATIFTMGVATIVAIGNVVKNLYMSGDNELLLRFPVSGAEILICTKSDLVVRDIDLLREMGKVTVSWSINTLDEDFRRDMDKAVSIERRLCAMKQVYDAGIRTVCFIAPVFPGITDFEAIFHRVKNQCDLVWLENLNLRGGFKQEILDYIQEKHPHLTTLYQAIYQKGDRSYFRGLEQQAEQLAMENGCPFVDNELPYGRAEPGHPVIVDYFYHEEVRGSENTGKRKRT